MHAICALYKFTRLDDFETIQGPLKGFLDSLSVKGTLLLAREGINIELISTSEIKISIGVNDKYLELAVRTLHKAFELDADPTEESLEPLGGE